MEYIWTSQSNLKDYIPGNWLKNNDYEFPDGLENFSRQLIEWGFKPGLWASPFWFFGEAEGMYEAHRDHLLCDREGNPSALKPSGAGVTKTTNRLGITCTSTTWMGRIRTPSAM